MTRLSVLILFFFGLVCISAAQNVSIGNQIWMTKNLGVSNFRNGDPIPEAKTKEEWLLAGKNGEPAWCYYDNDPANGEKYGKLYNWYAVNDLRGLAPVGYHVPSDSEWKQLIKNLAENIEFLDTAEEITKQLMDKANEIGFSALPSGARSNDGPFGLLGSSGYWWSSKESSMDPKSGAWFQEFDYKNIEAIEGGKDNGMSVRCLKD